MMMMMVAILVNVKRVDAMYLVLFLTGKVESSSLEGERDRDLRDGREGWTAFKGSFH